MKQAKQADSADGFVASTGAVGANGELLRWLWENREAIIEFISTLINFIPKTVGASEDSVDLRAIVADLKA